MASPEQLAAGAACIDRCIPDGLKLSVLVYQVGLLTGVTDPTTMVAGARCIDNCLPAGMRLSALIYLFDNFISGGSGGFVQCGVGAPTSAPAAGCGMWIDTSNDAVYIYRNGAWALKV